MKSFKEFLTEGGNVIINGIPAERMDLRKISRKEAVASIKAGLSEFNNAFLKKAGLPIWSAELFNSVDFLSGSTKAFFDLSGIDDDSFVGKKPTVGDIDLMVDGSLTPILKEFLDTLKQGAQFGPMTWVGYKPSGDQFITLWETDFGQAVQVDLERVEFINGKPTQWSTFSHSSAWDDMKKGIKGVFHKFVLQALPTKSSREIVILKGKKQVPHKTFRSDYIASIKGIRQQIRPVMDENGNQRYIDDLAVFTEMPAKGAKYFNDMETLFAILFNGAVPKGSDLTNINSFSGMIELMKKYLNQTEQKNVVNRFARILFGRNAQRMYRGKEGRLQDFRDKTTALRYISSELDVEWSSYVPMIKQYYRAYK